MTLKIILSVFVLLAAVPLKSDGYSYLKPLFYGEAECIDDDWEVHPIGSLWYDDSNCEKLECVFHKGTLYAKGYGCSAIGVPSGCQLVPGSRARYPHCCPRVKCEEGIICEMVCGQLLTFHQPLTTPIPANLCEAVGWSIQKKRKFKP